MEDGNLDGGARVGGRGLRVHRLPLRLRPLLRHWRRRVPADSGARTDLGRLPRAGSGPLLLIRDVRVARPNSSAPQDHFVAEPSVGCYHAATILSDLS